MIISILVYIAYIFRLLNVFLSFVTLFITYNITGDSSSFIVGPLYKFF